MTPFLCKLQMERERERERIDSDWQTWWGGTHLLFWCCLDQHATPPLPGVPVVVAVSGDTRNHHNLHSGHTESPFSPPHYHPPHLPEERYQTSHLFHVPVRPPLTLFCHYSSGTILFLWHVISCAVASSLSHTVTVDWLSEFVQ